MAKAQNKTVYITPNYQDLDDRRSRLEAHKMGKSCLYIMRLSDVEKDVLQAVIAKGPKTMEEKYPQ